MAWTNIPNTDIDQDSPVTQPLMTAIRDNIEWASPFIATADLSSDATVEFSLSTDYDAFMFSFQNVIPATNAVDLIMRTSTDGGSTYDSGASDYIIGASTSSSMPLALSVSNNTSYGVSGHVFIHGAHLAKITYVLSDVRFLNSSSTQVRTNSTALARNSAADVDSVRFLFASGNLASGTITQYGWRNDG